MGTHSIDYDALAQQHGASIDFDALAAQHGATTAPIDAQAPQKEFLDRVNSRIAGNIKSIATPLKTIHDFTEEIKRRSAQPYVPFSGLKETWESLKTTYSDPANVLGDITTAGILHSIGGGGEEAAPERAAEAPIQAAPKVSPKLADLLQSKIQNAAARFVAKRIPGAHVAMDLKELWDAVHAEQGTLQAPPAATTPAGPTGPPELWGKSVAPETPDPYAAARKASEPIPEAASPAAQQAYAFRPSIERILPPEPTPADTSPANLEKLLTEGTGGKPLEKGVPLREQGKAPSLPEGFTPVKSSALKGYKYNADAKEFETVTQGGQHYIHGDVSPEQAAEFEAADSKGKAWGNLKSNATLVAKVVNGQRMAVKPLSAPAATPMDDILNQMLEQIKAGKTLKDLK